MSNFTVVRARVSPEKKAAAMANVKEMGLDLSTVIRMVINRLAMSKELPVDLIQPVPNAVTQMAMQEAIDNRKNGTLGKGYTSLDEMMKEIQEWNE